jgi:hypothetical protein
MDLVDRRRGQMGITSHSIIDPQAAARSLRSRPLDLDDSGNGQAAVDPNEPNRNPRILIRILSSPQGRMSRPASNITKMKLSQARKHAEARGFYFLESDRRLPWQPIIIFKNRLNPKTLQRATKEGKPL